MLISFQIIDRNYPPSILVEPQKFFTIWPCMWRPGMLNNAGHTIRKWSWATGPSIRLSKESKAINIANMIKILQRLNFQESYQILYLPKSITKKLMSLWLWQISTSKMNKRILRFHQRTTVYQSVLSGRKLIACETIPLYLYELFINVTILSSYICD